MLFSCRHHFRFRVVRKQYKIPRFPYTGYKIVQLSDFHLGFSLNGTILNSITDSVLSLAPDIVVITGDLFEGDVKQLSEHLLPLKQLAQSVPVYFVVGNHDFEYNPPETVIAILESIGITVLLNQSIWIGGESGFSLAGVADHSARIGHLDKRYHPDIDKTLADTKTNAPIILLSHRPILRYLKNHPVDLMLSGHLHGGQILPFGLLSIHLYEDSGEEFSIKDRRFEGPKYLHVSKGVGCTTLPFRFLVKSEISLIEISPL